MPDPGSLSVVIPAFNAERFLERAVESVFGTHYPEVEVVIVDDGSEDGTVRVAERLCSTWTGQCRLVRHSDHANHGVSASRNLGIRSSTSAWVALLDADDFYMPQRFDALRRFQTERRTFDAIYELCEIRLDGDGVTPTPRNELQFGIARSLTGPDLLADLLQGHCWATSAITIRRTLLERTGLFDPRKRIAEDCDLWFRLAAVGIVVSGNLEMPVSVYWRHAHNTYTYDIQHRVSMVHAMLDAWRWAEKAGADERMLEILSRGVQQYARRTIVAARSAKSPVVARRVLGLMARERKFGFFAKPETWRQMIGLLRAAGDPLPPSSSDTSMA